MGDLVFMALPILIVVTVICIIAVPLSSMYKKTFGSSSSSSGQTKDAKYSRQVHQMHVKDAAGERRHRLDQLKSLYEAGMMERDEYNERVEAVEADYRGRY
ncbi:MAG: hypothetical protein J6J07_00015 [Oscillospiraceae bacterium]|nr:hypothetical protein [Oscillospiraceae bacterium]MBQ5321816.1 hypothetical protein [Oscillospiraceae bacterium]